MNSPIPPNFLLPVGTRALPALPPALLNALDKGLLDAEGRMHVLPAAELRRVPHTALQVWMQARGRYQLPTVELVEWLRARIAGRPSVEIGAGCGDVGRAVGGVTLTDSYFQTKAEIQRHYGTIGSQPISPPPDVMRREGLRAAMRYQPDVCLACWVTQAYAPGDKERETGSCVGGVDFHELLRWVGELVFVGNAGTHRDMRLLQIEHEEYAPDWLVSRAHDQSANRIWVWKGRKGEA